MNPQIMQLSIKYFLNVNNLIISGETIAIFSRTLLEFSLTAYKGNFIVYDLSLASGGSTCILITYYLTKLRIKITKEIRKTQIVIPNLHSGKLENPCH